MWLSRNEKASHALTDSINVTVGSKLLLSKTSKLCAAIHKIRCQTGPMYYHNKL